VCHPVGQYIDSTRVRVADLVIPDISGNGDYNRDDHQQPTDATASVPTETATGRAFATLTNANPVRAGGLSRGQIATAAN